MKNDSSVAVFIDVENIHYSTVNNYSETPDWTYIVDACREYGRISSIQAFGDWIQFADEVHEIQSNGIKPVFVPLSQDGKSSLDCYLTVSAMKLFFQNNSIDTFVLASGDRDYIPLLAELKALGNRVYILAVPESLSQDLKKIVDGVISYKPIKENKFDKAAKNSVEKKLMKDFVLETLKISEKTSLNDRWVNLASIGSLLNKKDPNFSHRKFGYKKLAELLDDIEEIEIKYDNYEKTVAVARTCTPKAKITENNLNKGKILTKKDGYGFIKPHDGSENLFFHGSGLINLKYWELKEGDNVSYTTFNTERGLNAGKIEVIV